VGVTAAMRAVQPLVLFHIHHVAVSRHLVDVTVKVVQLLLQVVQATPVVLFTKLFRRPLWSLNK